jgi:membrane protein DedA with SNARE-associated domain
MERLAELVLDPGLPAPLVYAVLFVGCVLESFFPPWPADVITMYTAFLAGRGLLAPGVMGAFWIARLWGRSLLAGPLGRYLPVGQLDRLEGWFGRYGAPAIAISRFFPGIRALVTPAAGLAGFAAWKVWVFAGASVVLWNVFVVGLGLVAGRELEWSQRLLVRYNAVALAVAALVVASVIAVALWRRRRGR